MGLGRSPLENMGMNPEFWKGRKVVLTGHTGFKGSWLALWLQKLGVELTGFSLDLPSNPCLFEAAGVASGMRSITGDIRNLEQLKGCLTDHEPEIVIHMAAQSLVRRSYRDPIETYTTNVIGTANLLEAVRGTPSVSAVLIITSDKCYENHELERGYREEEAMGGFDPYSSSKGCAELVTSAYRSSFFNRSDYQQHGVAVASARSGNVIGGGDWADDRIIPDIINAYQAGRPALLRNPDATRPWQFVLDPLHGYLILAERLVSDGAEFAESWNFGPDDKHRKKVSWLADQLATGWREGARWEQHRDEQPHETTTLVLDSAKARSRLSWLPLQTLETTMSWIVEWYREYLMTGDARKITLDQIRCYENLMESCGMFATCSNHN